MWKNFSTRIKLKVIRVFCYRHSSKEILIHFYPNPCLYSPYMSNVILKALRITEDQDYMCNRPYNIISFVSQMTICFPEGMTLSCHIYSPIAYALCIVHSALAIKFFFIYILMTYVWKYHLLALLLEGSVETLQISSTDKFFLADKTCWESADT